MIEKNERLDEYTQPLIEELLPHFYEANGENPRYEKLRSIPIDGHDIAWMEFSGEVSYDITGQGREGNSYSGRTLCCACDFTEGVGWKNENGQRYSLDGEKKCLPRKAALFLRQQELRQEYLERFKNDDIFKDGTYGLRYSMPEIILDLIEKQKAGEFIGEDGNGAEFWGGHFYLQTIEAITDTSMKFLWLVVDKMVEDKQIGIEGSVIQSYREPTEPLWKEYGRFEFVGWTAIASLPAHSKMSQEWRFTLIDENGEEVTSEIPGQKLTHIPLFGPDVDDVASAERVVQELINKAKAERQA